MKPTRRIGIVAALALAAGLGLAGCSDDKPGTESEPQSVGQQSQAGVEITVDREPTMELPEIKGSFGETPEMIPTDAEPPTEIVSEVLEAGDGDEVDENAILAVNYAGWLWDGTPFDSSFSRGEPAVFSLNTVIQGWKYGLAGTNVGDRVLLVIPSEWGYGPEGTSNIPGGSTLVFVVDVLDSLGADTSVLDEAKLTENSLPAGLAIEGDLGAEPVITFKDGAVEPADEETIVIAEGKGPVITAEQTVVYHYTAQYWGEDVAATTTWGAGPEAIPAANSLFLGEKVGSRLALIFPPIGDEQPSMVMVVDILDAYTP